ncbi:transcription factor HES-1-A-like [Anneissia japonica]|uniref:transcription factor HES-1-A-like n=1 Tax=Anneissia japonica TaxID=1529436 RepID=UPI001425AE11|nr:transcription factor HES-1-A-like [Anneissia japonica]
MPVDNTKTKTTEGRKSSKPLMEKRRRARINDSLGQLKTLILEATNKDSSRHSKLEKADILEMTVKYLRNMQRHQIASAMATDPSLLGRYRAGYNECMGEVSRFLNSAELNTDVQARLIGHLASTCRSPSSQATNYVTTTQGVNSIQTTAPTATSSSPGHPIQITQAQQIPSATNVQAVPSVVVNHSHTSPMSNNNSSIVSGNELCGSNVTRVVSGIPIGLQSPTGEITVVLPPQAVANGQIPSHFIPVYAQSTPLLTPPPSLGSPSSSLGSPNITSPQTPTTVQSNNSAVESRFTSYPHTSTSPVVIANQHQMQGPVPMVLQSQPPACYTIATSPVQHPVVEEKPVKMMVCNQVEQAATESVWRPWH